MAASTFTAKGDRVLMSSEDGFAYLDHGQCEAILAIFDAAGAAKLHCALYAAFIAAGGIPLTTNIKDAA